MPDSEIPDVIVLAAGLGRRMLPLTEQVPKPLIKVAGRALIDRAVDCCAVEGCTRFAINIHYLMPQMRTHIGELAKRYPQAEFAISEESKQLLDSGGGAKKALALTGTDPVLVVNSDAFWVPGQDQSLARLQAQMTDDVDMVLLCVLPSQAKGFRRSHDFCLAPDRHITNDRGAPVIYTGVALVRRAMFADRPEGPFSMLELMDSAREAEKLRGVLLDATWLHVGDPEAIVEAEAALAALTGPGK